MSKIFKEFECNVFNVLVCGDTVLTRHIVWTLSQTILSTSSCQVWLFSNKMRSASEVKASQPRLGYALSLYRGCGPLSPCVAGFGWGLRMRSAVPRLGVRGGGLRCGCTGSLESVFQYQSRKATSWGLELRQCRKTETVSQNSQIWVHYNTLVITFSTLFVELNDWYFSIT